MSKSSVLSALSVIAIAGFVLVGCAREPLDVASPPAVIPSPTATATTPEWEVPQPLLDSTCEEIAPPSTYAALSTTPLEPVPPANDFVGPLSTGITYPSSLRQLQSTLCTWSNSEPRNDGRQRSDTYTALTVVALPSAASAWAHYAEVYHLAAAEPVDCNEREGKAARCWWTGLVGDSIWVDIVFEGMKNSGDTSTNVRNVTPLIQTIKTNIAASSTGKSWFPPPSDIAISDGCASLLSAETIASAVGGPASGIRFSRDWVGGVALGYEADVLLGSDDCSWISDRVPSEYGQPISVLQGGEWAWLAAAAIDTAIRDATPLDLTGLAEGDSAWLRSTSDIPTADLIVGGHWITLSIYEESDQSALDTDAILTKLVQGIVDDLR